MEPSAASSALPLILIELVLVFGGVLAFGWWQLHSVKRDRAQMLAERAQRASADAACAPAASRGVDRAACTSAAPTSMPTSTPIATAAARPIDPDRPAPSPRSPMP